MRLSSKLTTEMKFVCPDGSARRLKWQGLVSAGDCEQPVNNYEQLRLPIIQRGVLIGVNDTAEFTG
jgi:hypothetical protein